MIVAVRQHYRGFGAIDPATLSALITSGAGLVGNALKIWQAYQAASEADKARAWAALGYAGAVRRQYEALWAEQAAANAPPTATSALPGWVWPAAGATAVLIVLGGIALALRRE